MNRYSAPPPVSAVSCQLRPAASSPLSTRFWKSISTAACHSLAELSGLRFFRLTRPISTPCSSETDSAIAGARVLQTSMAAVGPPDCMAATSSPLSAVAKACTALPACSGGVASAQVTVDGSASAANSPSNGFNGTFMAWAPGNRSNQASCTMATLRIFLPVSEFVTRQTCSDFSHRR